MHFVCSVFVWWMLLGIFNEKAKNCCGREDGGGKGGCVLALLTLKVKFLQASQVHRNSYSGRVWECKHTVKAPLLTRKAH